MTTEEILQKCTIEGNVVKLPTEQLDKPTYSKVKTAIEKIGGKWKGGKVFGFVFQEDPTDLMADISGGKKRNLKQESQFFATPQELAERMVYIAFQKAGGVTRILEPSAGQGAIIKEINKVSNIVPDCYELMPLNQTVLTNDADLRCNLLGTDFLQSENGMYDRIIANPPFTKNQDIDHIRFMYNILRSGGRLVCISSESATEGKQQKQTGFQIWLDTIGAIRETLPRGTFQKSGTSVGATLLIIDKK